MNEELSIRLVATGKEGPCCESLVDVCHELSPVMSAICKWLAKYDIVRFEVAGFGQAVWPVDVAVDLAVVVEQIPSVLRGLLQKREVNLDFYEQGIQRLLTCAAVDDEHGRVSCRSGLSGWTPVPDEYVLERRDAPVMLKTLGESFVNVADRACPGPTSNRAFRAWLEDFRSTASTLNGAGPS